MIFIIQIDATEKISSSSRYKNIKINNYNSKNVSSIKYIRTQRKENDKQLGENKLIVLSLVAFFPLIPKINATNTLVFTLVKLMGQFN